MKSVAIDDNLETALLFAGDEEDITGLKAIARQENAKWQKMRSLMLAVLEVTGPVKLKVGAISNPVRGAILNVSIVCDEWTLSVTKPGDLE